jgi:hypothetical protein
MVQGCPSPYNHLGSPSMTPAAERLSHLCRIRDEWTAKVLTFDTSNDDLLDTYAAAIADLNALIQRVEREAVRPVETPRNTGNGNTLTLRR